MKHRIGILLSGCGAYDGSDSHEAVLTMLRLEEMGHEAVPMALDLPQLHCVDHTTGREVEGEVRSQLAESARLVRGKIYAVQDLSPKLFAGLVIPGGQGGVKNLLSGFGSMAPQEVDPRVRFLLEGVHESGGVIAAVSLSEFVVSAVFGPWPEGKGCLELAPGEVLVDKERRLLLTPGYTMASSMSQLNDAIARLCREMTSMIEAFGEPA